MFTSGIYYYFNYIFTGISITICSKQSHKYIFQIKSINLFFIAQITQSFEIPLFIVFLPFNHSNLSRI